LREIGSDGIAVDS